MKFIVAIALALSSAGAAQAADTAASEPAAASSPLSAEPAPAAASSARANMSKVTPEDAGFCLYGGAPAGGVKYTTLRNIKTSRETYGGVTDELPRFVATAKASGADAVIHYNGAQRFGFWPWRLVRPVLSGVPIKFEQPAPDCATSGGVTFAGVMASNKEPPRK
jgi:hypothetical protein